MNHHGIGRRRLPRRRYQRLGCDPFVLQKLGKSHAQRLRRLFRFGSVNCILVKPLWIAGAFNLRTLILYH